MSTDPDLINYPDEWPENLVGWVKGSSQYYPITQNEEEPPICACKGFSFRRTCRHIKDFLKGRFVVIMQFVVTFKNGQDTVARVEGIRQINSNDLTIQEAAEKVLDTEAFLEKLTGLRVHIEQIL